MNICIYGGSFNPVHRGHIALAQTALKQGGFDQLWMMLSPANPLKKNSELMSDSVRYKLLQIAVKGRKGLVACDFELSMPRPSYTIHTLKALQQHFPQHHFTLLIGADNWLKFTEWYAHDEILNNYPIIIYPRKGCTIDENKLPSTVKMLKTRLYNVSSSEIRQRLAERKELGRMVPKAIYQELINMKLNR